MNLASRSDAVIPLPDFPSSLAAEIRRCSVGLRRFGIFESDLAIDFAAANVPALITRILEQCTVDPDGVLPAEFFRDLSAGKRLECLLRLASGELSAPLNFPFRCIGCGVELEVDLSLEEIAEIQREADLIERVEVELDGRPVLLRKPSGRDQEEWAQIVFRDGREAMEAMIGTLAIDPAVAENIQATGIDLIDEAMNDADPLINFVFRVVCADCESANELMIDLQDVALRMLSRQQQQLVVLVHKLASHYHWSEREIFEVPHWRRKEYLELIAAGR